MLHNRTVKYGLGLVCLALGMAVTASAFGWTAEGHRAATVLAVKALADSDCPKFFLAEPAEVAESSIDPDLIKHEKLPNLASAEHPEQYIDIELLKGAEFPLKRYEFIRWCSANRIDPSTVGLLPYATTEWTERLAMAFAEHRKTPDNARIKAKCLLYAGILAHYAEDLCQPLHTTVDFDGRLGSDGKSPRTGIHLKTDMLLGKIKPAEATFLKTVKPEPFKDLFPAILLRLKQSHALVNRVYELKKTLPDPHAELPNDAELKIFAEERLKASVELTASLYLTAWKLSAEIQLPEWYEEKKEETTDKNR